MVTNNNIKTSIKPDTAVTARARLGGVWMLLHPGPSLITVAAFIICAVIAARGTPAPLRLVLTALGMVCMQFAISALNDYCDRAADSQSEHKRKPIPLGLVTPTFALGLALILAVAMVVLYAPFGFGPSVTALAFLLLGFAYDLGVKSTPFSGVMLGLAFPIIPLLAWELFAQVKPALGWTFALGMALGIAIHLADALPDRAADQAASVHGLTQLLGQHALAACRIALGVAIALIVLLPLTNITPARPAIIVSAACIATGLVIGAIIDYHQGQRAESERLKRNFLFVIATALVTTVGWLAGAVV